MKMFLGLLQLGERGMGGRGGGAEGKEGDRREIEWGLVKEGWWGCRMIPQQVVSPTYLFL